MNINKEFCKCVQECYCNSINFDPKSPKKIIPLHIFLAKKIEQNLGKKYTCYANGYRKYNGKDEAHVQGRYYKKNVDIAVENEKGDIVGVMEVKFYRNNVNQNDNNNIEGLLGYTSNLKNNNLVMGIFILKRTKSPYLKDGGILKKIEDSKGIEKKYKAIINCKNDYLHIPDWITICNISTGNEKVYYKNIENRIYKDDGIKKELFEQLKVKIDGINFNAKNKSIKKQLKSFSDLIKKKL